jgi:hypothetical protein
MNNECKVKKNQCDEHIECPITNIKLQIVNKI